MNAARATCVCRAAVAAALSVACATQAARAAEPQSPWGAGILTQARLVVAQDGLSSAGTIQGAIEIALPPGAATYWAFPGPNGFAPTIATTGSVNLGRFDLDWPVPRLLAASPTPGHESPGYRDRVMLPFDVAAADPARPVVLALEIEIGVCDDICVPDFVAIDLVLSAGVGARSTHADRIARARASVPAPNATAGLHVLGVARASPDSPLAVRARAAEGFAAPLLFVESLSADCRTVVAPIALRGGEAEFHVAAACGRNGSLAMVLSDGGIAVRAELPVRE
jgi:DsbC/DsbD-like thiol-disulfide interchange protein